MTYDLKNEAEVKQFIENLGIEYRFGCYSEKNPEACHLLGEYLQSVKKDFAKAGKIFKSNCDDYNHGRSCHSYGIYTSLGRGKEIKDNEVALKYFNKGCDLNVPDSCFNAGLCYTAINDKDKNLRDYTKGISVFKKGCNLKHSFSCYHLSGLYIFGTADNVVSKDMNLAFKYATKACDLGNIYACANLIIMYQRGEGVEKNVEMSEKMKRKVSDLRADITSKETLEFSRGSNSKV